jgi:hypothetical protein
MTANTCGSCKHRHLIRAQPTDFDGQLVCRRFPPTVTVALVHSEGLDGRISFTPRSYTSLPDISKGDWCGEYTASVYAEIE